MNETDLRPRAVSLFVVVCTDLHSAHGPFNDYALALRHARERTDAREGGCVYLPIPLLLEGTGAQMVPETTSAPGGSDDSDWKPGKHTYL